MKNKKLLVALIAFVVLIAVAVGIWFATRPEAPAEEVGAKAFSVIVVHADGTEKTFEYKTDGEYLGPVLVEKGLIVESESKGLYNIVDGETADWDADQSYWSFYIGDEMAMYGMNDAVIHDGDVFKLVYTK
ncbi:MAG: DUF4430 domain-containing protein [Oscillospiraceae bacterium]|nr:DUF4430 domain-containing protein [Oscillospiraceae bacterium]